MNNIFLHFRNGFFVVALLTTPLYPKPSDEWSSKDGATLLLAAAGAAAIGYCAYYISTTFRDQYHEEQMNQARQAVENSGGAYYDIMTDGADDDQIRSELEQYKKDLNGRWITSYQHGMNLSFSQHFSGRVSASNILSSHLSLSGLGFVTNSHVSSSTKIDGDYIINKSRLKGTVNVGGSTQFVSFENCLLGDIVFHKNAILELKDCIVDGKIVFPKDGAVVLDKKTVIKGIVQNGRLVKGSVEKK